MADPLVTICIPTYRGAPWLAACLESALAQTQTDLEVLVVDDASDDDSDDDTAAIGLEFAGRDDRVIVLSALEQKLAAERVDARTERLSNALDGLPDNAYDYVLIDCPPNVGLLTFNALRAATEVIVPLETSRFAIHGVERLLETIALLSERIGGCQVPPGFS